MTTEEEYALNDMGFVVFKSPSMDEGITIRIDNIVEILAHPQKRGWFYIYLAHNYNRDIPIPYKEAIITFAKATIRWKSAKAKES